MKTRIQNLFFALAILSSINSQLSTAFAQGSLTPPGAPAPTMKSLDQIEPRTIVNAANTPGDGNNVFIISQSGSYYLTTNLVGVSGKNGIEITANDVTLDLNGFALQGGSGSENGIYIPICANVTVRNGTVSGWDGLGVDSVSSSSFNLVFERLNISASGSIGIFIAGAGMVHDCNSQNNSLDGIHSGGGIISGCNANNNGGIGISLQSGTMSGCNANNNGSHGIFMSGGTMSGCRAQNNSQDGINMAGGGTVSGCYAQNNAGRGIYVAPGTVSGCFAKNNVQSGIYVNLPGSEVIGNTCIGNNTGNFSSQAGIYINDKNNRVEDNHVVTASGYPGIVVDGNGSYVDNIVIKNSVIGNGANGYLMPGTQIVGPIVTNTVSGIITNSNPWANFSF